MFKIVSNKKYKSLLTQAKDATGKLSGLNSDNEKLKESNAVFTEFLERLVDLKKKYGMKAIVFDDKIVSSFEAPAIKDVQKYLKTLKVTLTPEQILWVVRTFNTQYPVVSCSIEHDVRFKAAQKCLNKTEQNGTNKH